MKKINITEADIDAVSTEIVKFASDLPSPENLVNSHPPAIKVIDCVLSLRRDYDKIVIPRLKNFGSKRPDIQSVSDLANLMTNYPTPDAFMISELNHNSKVKPKMLQEVVKFVCQIVERSPRVAEEDVLKKWAIQAKPQECYTLNIKNFKLAGFQYLRMLFGADTTKPDIHIIRFISDILNRNVSDIESLYLLEAACKREDLSVRAVDKYIWEQGAGSGNTNITTSDAELRPEYDETLLKNGIRGKYAKQYAAGTNIVRLDPDVADAFPTEAAVNEALRFVLKAKSATWHKKLDDLLMKH